MRALFMFFLIFIFEHKIYKRFRENKEIYFYLHLINFVMHKTRNNV